MGPWGIAALIAVLAMSTETGRAYAKKVLRSGLRAGCHAKESAGELAEKAKEYKDELIAEIRADGDDETSHDHKTKKRTKTATH